MSSVLRPLLTAAAGSGWITPSSVTNSRPCNSSPAISSTAFDTRPPDLPPASLMDTDFVIIGQLVRRPRLIRFLYIGPYLCSALPSDPTTRGAALALRHPSPPSDWDGTCTRKLSNMHGVQKKHPRKAFAGAGTITVLPTRSIFFSFSLQEATALYSADRNARCIAATAFQFRPFCAERCRGLPGLPGATGGRRPDLFCS